MNEQRVAVVTDSTADLALDLVRERGVTVVPLTVVLDGQGYLDGVEMTAAEFYARLGASDGAATTSQPAPGRFAEVYERLLADHDEVVSLHISARLSGTFEAATQGASLVDAARVHVVDTEMVSMPLGLLTLAASAMAAGGDGAAAIVERLRPLRQRMRVYFMVATLEYLRRGGRIGRASALVGSVLQVKPVLTLAEGQVAPLERVRTQDRALARVIELASAVDRPVCALVGHAAADEAAERIARALEPYAESLIVAPLGPVVGAHAGPGTVGVGCYPAELFPLGLKRLSSTAAR
ncbi:MAG TPA: DegV family protein [Candidatus Dormibacteraeota bacterium]|nr:DegV family protein [Candidatus Dormibacteraeota bacterium]